MLIAPRVSASLIAVALLVAPAAARADPVADAAALQGQIDAWIADLLGPAREPGAPTVRVAPEGGGLRVEWPIAGVLGQSGWTLIGEPVTAMVRPLEAGRWAIDSIRLPSPMRAERKGGDADEPRSLAMTIADQAIHGVLDPSFATASFYDGTWRDYATVVRFDDGTQVTHFDRAVMHGGWEPLGEGRGTVDGETRIDNLSVVTDLPATGRVVLTAASARGSGRMESVAASRVGAAFRSIVGLLPTAMIAGGSSSLPDQVSDDDRARLRTLLQALTDLLGGTQAETVLERLSLEAPGGSGTLARFSVGGHAAAPGGVLDAAIRIGFEGLRSSLVPPGAMRDYLPRRFVLATRVSGVPVNDVLALLQRAAEMDDPSPLADEALSLLGRQPVTIGLDELVLDLGPAVLKATGSVNIAAADDIQGQTVVVATGVDALIRRAMTVPDLKAVAPMLIFLKGLGQQKGNVTTWTVTYADGKAQVNGTDIGALTGSGDENGESFSNKRRP